MSDTTVTCEYPACAKEIDAGSAIYLTPERFYRYGKDPIILCWHCKYEALERDNRWRDNEGQHVWFDAELVRRWPIGVTRPRRPRERVLTWVKEQANVYHERTGVEVFFGYGPLGWKFHDRQFLPLDGDNGAAEQHMRDIMDGHV